MPRLNPIFLRECREVMRTDARRDPWALAFATAAIIVVGLLSFISSRGYYHVSTPTVGFVFLALIQGVLMNRFMNPAASVARERAQNTHESLILSPLTPHGYVRGQVFTEIVAGLRRASILLPFYAGLYILGGFSFWRFLVLQVCMIVFSVQSLLASFAWTEIASGNNAFMLQFRRSLMRGGRNVAINPVALVSLVLLVPLALIFISPIGSLAAQTFASPQGIPLAPGYEYLRLLVLSHPALLLIFWGDLPVYDIPVPVWILALATWFVISQASYFTFTYHFTHRKFRYNPGLRVSRIVLFTYVQLIIVGVCWDEPEIGLWVSILTATIYALLRFAGPRTFPTQDNERWQVLPRKDIIIHRAGNMLPFLLIWQIPLLIGHLLLILRSSTPNFETVVLILDSTLILATASILLLNQVLQMRAAIKKRGIRISQSAQDANVTVSDVAKIRPTQIVSPVLLVAGILWFAPLPFAAIENAAQGTRLHPPALIARQVTEPLLLINPWRVAFNILDNNASRPSNPPAAMNVFSPMTVPGWPMPINYYVATIVTLASVTVGSGALYLITSRKAARALS